jgi:hypothetical protein
MDLSINNTLDADDILAVSMPSPGHPVYILSGPNLSRLVIKQEMTYMAHGTGQKESLRTNVNIMHAVDKDAHIVVMTAAEVQEVRDFVQHEQLVANAVGGALSPALQNLSNALAGGGKWVKMGVKRMSDLKAAGLDRIAGDKMGVRQFAAALNADGGLEKLGKILAADLFNDNQDRCSVGGGMAFNSVGLRYLVNVGNVLLSSGKLSGLDSWDPGGPTKETRQHLAAVDPNNEWGGYLLGPAGQVTVNGNVVTRDAFAAGVIADLEVVLGPRKRRLGILRKQRLDKHAKTRLLTGMTSGAGKIRTHLRGIGFNALPVLIQDKVTALGWIPL